MKPDSKAPARKPALRVARVAVDLSLDRCFDYAVPDRLADRVAVGSRVVVSFGRRQAQGTVTELCSDSSHASLKEIASVCGDIPLITPELMKLARWMADYYCAPLEAALRTVLPSTVRRRPNAFRTRRIASATDMCDASAIEAHRQRAPRQAALLTLLRQEGPVAVPDLLVRSGAGHGALTSLVAKGLVAVAEDAHRRDPLSHRHIVATAPLTLMPQQTEALSIVTRGMDSGKASIVLLYGVTGSGKTEVYLQAIAHGRRSGRGAIVLVPEISLTPQTVERFVGRFGERVAVLHSRLSDGERHDEWQRIRRGEADMVIGARSAVFAPVRNLGLIVVDEEHEHTYKQDEAPRYNARDVAVMRAHNIGCAVVLGSATPSLESWANAISGKYQLAKLPHRVDHRTMPHVRIVDMRLQTDESGRGGVFSRDLLDAIQARLDRAEQVILFLNRRGFATSLICHRCGYVAACGHCSVSLTYHRGVERLLCHICGDSRTVPDCCPECRDPTFKYTGVGTQRVENIVAKCFPKARVARLDTDATRRKDVYENVLGDFRSGKTHILIGTQMIAKGLHFPNVTLVGVVHADTSLHLPDFRAGERTFQLLAQVSGRAGRGDVAGEVIVQTYTPFHPAIQHARRQDFEGFSAEEIEFRRELGYPPFAHLVCVGMRGASEERTSRCLTDFRHRLAALLKGKAMVSDACPAPLARAKGQYRYQVMIRSRSPRQVAGAIRSVLADLQPLPKQVICTVDVDALNML